MSHDSQIQTLNNFKSLISSYEFALLIKDYIGISKIRSNINQNKIEARELVIKSGCFRMFTISPPQGVVALILRDIDLFNVMFEPPFGRSVFPLIIDMCDEAIGAIRTGALDRSVQNAALPVSEIRMGYVFVAMAIDESIFELEDTLDAIRAVCSDRGLQAERIDDQQKNSTITERIFESIRVCQFIIVDLTHPRPNVYYEAGYAQGIGKIPIFIAKEGTRLEFDLKDYPVIFWKNHHSLREKLSVRLEAISKK